MNYLDFLHIVSSHRKHLYWAAGVPISVGKSKGRQIYFDYSQVFLSRDTGPVSEKNEIAITNKEVDPKWAVKEVFIMFNSEVNK